MDATSIPAQAGSVRRLPRRVLVLRGDEALVARVRGGDEIAFEVLYERHAGGILSFCRHMLRSQAEAEDAAQQAFASAHGAMLGGEREINFKPWLYAIARNRCLSILRARTGEEEEEAEISVAGLADEVQRRADLRELVADLHDLPPDQRAALVLTELGDLSHAEVAEVLGCGTANVKGLVFRARSGLIERRDSRAAPCAEIREELANARRGAFRRGRLRHHLKACPGCTAYLGEVRRQRQMMALALPVVPGLTLKSSVMAAVGLGAGTAAGGGGLAAGGLASGATLAKAATAVVMAGSGVAAGNAVLDHPAPPPARAPVTAPAPSALPFAEGDAGAAGRDAGHPSRGTGSRRGDRRGSRRSKNRGPRSGSRAQRLERGGAERAARRGRNRGRMRNRPGPAPRPARPARARPPERVRPPSRSGSGERPSTRLTRPKEGINSGSRLRERRSGGDPGAELPAP